MAVAEVAGSLCGSNQEANACERVEVILKLNSNQFRSDLVKHFSALIKVNHDSEFTPNAPETGVENGSV